MKKYSKIDEAVAKKWLLLIKEEWVQNPQGCENFVRLIEKKYDGDYNYYCSLSRRLLRICHRRGGVWYFK